MRGRRRVLRFAFMKSGFDIFEQLKLPGLLKQKADPLDVLVFCVCERIT